MCEYIPFYACTKTFTKPLLCDNASSGRSSQQAFSKNLKRISRLEPISGMFTRHHK